MLNMWTRIGMWTRSSICTRGSRWSMEDSTSNPSLSEDRRHNTNQLIIYEKYTFKFFYFD